ncbi:MAG: hypothetical protein IKW03_05955 [Clostridia bacterium]|nr:hypothetical protein [Clostridia bacterium]
MTKVLKRFLTFIIISVICLNSLIIPVYAVSSDDINIESVFLKQETAVTCTLSSATMMLRRTAIIAGFPDWAEITEPNIRDTAWIDGVGLRWDFSFYGMTVGHGYYPDDADKKLFMIELLDKFPQGVVVYNTGKKGQTHAIFLCDYDKATDTFYVSDPASNIPAGRIPLMQSSIVGETQADKIGNLSAYWYVSTPEVRYKNGEFTSSGTVSNPYDPTHDSYSFEQTKERIHDYYVVNYDSAKGVALRYYPSGSSSSAKSVTKGTILYVTHKGKNNFGAEWYKLNSGHYIFSTNLISFDEYSGEIKKFNNTAVSSEGTYKASSKNGTVPVRIEPSEGNNVVANIENDVKLYITHSGDNSVGAKWLKTEDGHYVKAEDMTFVSKGKLEGELFKGTYSLVTGEYKSEPKESNGNANTPELVTGKYKITASALNLRKDAVNGEVYTSIPKDTVVEVVAISDGWGKTSYDGYVGWILLDYAVKVEEDRFRIESIKISADEAETGEDIVCTVSVTGTDKALYLFSVYNDSGEKIFSSTYTSNNSYTYKTTQSGSFYFFVEVKNADNKKLTSFSRNFNVYDKLQIESVKSNIDEFTYVSNEIMWTVDASSVSSDAVYIYALYCDGQLLFETESRFNEFSYVPEKAGKYLLYATLSDSRTKSETVEADEVNVYENVKIASVNVPATAVRGSQVKFSAEAVGGTGDYQYCFIVFRDGTIIKNGLFSSLNSDSFIPETEGTYLVFCTVMDSSNMISSAFSDEIIVVDGLTGDVDRNGSVSARDARIVLRHSAKLELMDDSATVLADVNKDGIINASDARRILRCAAKIETF